LNWFGDSLDGTLARYRKIERPRYGFFIDHTIDTFNIVIVFLGMGLSPYLYFETACLVLIGYLMLSCLVYINTCVDGVFKLSFAGLGPTEIRLMGILINTLVFFVGNPNITLPFGVYSFYDVVMIAIAILMFFFFIVSVFRQAVALSKVDQAKWRV
jgi:archaetidylinositol phosphate synthase